MLGKPRILSLLLNSFNKFNEHEYSCNILYVRADRLTLVVGVGSESLSLYHWYPESGVVLLIFAPLLTL